MPLAEAVEDFSSAPVENKFASYVCGHGWFVKKKLLGGYDGFRAIDVCWIYPLKVKHSVNFVPTTASWDVILKLRSGQQITLSSKESTKSGEDLMPADSDLCLRAFRSLLPWAIFGYSKYMAECWNKSIELFLSVQNKRLNIIRNGVEKGSIVVRPDGTLVATDPSFTLPTIKVKFDQNPKGKVSRVYYESTER